MTIQTIIFSCLAALLGYLIGRWGDNYLIFWMKDPSWAPHHWIYGLVLMIIGFLCFKNNLEMWIVFFGLGLFISDLKDFLEFFEILVNFFFISLIIVQYNFLSFLLIAFPLARFGLA